MSSHVRVDYYPKTKHRPEGETKASVVGETICKCPSTPINIQAITSGVVAKIPVVLAELTVRANISSTIKLPEYACEIKDIKKRVNITQCFLLNDTGMLFIKGFIRKDIQYSTLTDSINGGFYGGMRNFTADVPFSCTTDVIFNGISPAPILVNTSSEFAYSMKKDLLGEEFGAKDRLLQSNRTEYNQISTEFFNDLPYCDLVRAHIVELDEATNPPFPQLNEETFEERKFNIVDEKIVLDLTIKILQSRQVTIGPSGLMDGYK